jgi:hypothetical protein
MWSDRGFVFLVRKGEGAKHAAKKDRPDHRAIDAQARLPGPKIM